MSESCFCKAVNRCNMRAWCRMSRDGQVLLLWLRPQARAATRLARAASRKTGAPKEGERRQGVRTCCKKKIKVCVRAMHFGGARMYMCARGGRGGRAGGRTAARATSTGAPLVRLYALLVRSTYTLMNTCSAIDNLKTKHTRPYQPGDRTTRNYTRGTTT